MLRHWLCPVVVLAFIFDVAPLCSPGVAEAQGPNLDGKAQAEAAPSPSPEAGQKEAQPAGEKGIKAKVKAASAKVKAAISKMNPARLLREHEYSKAEATFPAFCKQWESLLHERERNNLNHINWSFSGGYETGTYTGYGAVKSCSCKKSPDGFAIGKLIYEEYVYHIIGKTQDEASHAKPSVVEETTTTELFRWDHGKWFY